MTVYRTAADVSRPRSLADANRLPWWSLWAHWRGVRVLRRIRRRRLSLLMRQIKAMLLHRVKKPCSTCDWKADHEGVCPLRVLRDKKDVPREEYPGLQQVLQQHGVVMHVRAKMTETTYRYMEFIKRSTKP